MSGRQRVDPRQRLSGRARAAVAAEHILGEVLRVENPSHLIGAVAMLDRGRLSQADLSLLAAARQVADSLGGAVVLILLLPLGEKLRGDPAQAGVDRVLELHHEGFAGYAPALRAVALSDVVETLELRHVLFSEDPLGGGDLGRRVAMWLGDRPATGMIRWVDDQVECRQDGGLTDVRRPAPRVLIVAGGAFAPIAEARLREARSLPAPVWRVASGDVRDGGLLDFDPQSVPIDEAELVVSAGNGLTDWSSFHVLAGLLGAAEAGSRAVVDAGHMPRTAQVGASGSLIAPACYIALGIAGASQHLQGIARCQRVIAVNTDLHAEMVRRADLAIIADAQAVMPALIRRLRVSSGG
ncbi:electron transfer flavoprotein subunit alpha/FixB family protein [Acidisoma sp. S159]|uniref:electron transfer flavoprotein subunit alpha/FixB family protein n=1 Tax=Acidisoma sp. S159 TaxID=1747225 RepID=UPI00131B350C|nr:electron transfer flavoprotein subunit alpha/FixB family protein [Acidisoma sp. S159]